MGLQQLAKNLKNARTKTNMTQAEVATKAKIHVNYYARIERAEENPSYEILENIAKALNTKLSKLVEY